MLQLDSFHPFWMDVVLYIRYMLIIHNFLLGLGGIGCRVDPCLVRNGAGGYSDFLPRVPLLSIFLKMDAFFYCRFTLSRQEHNWPQSMRRVHQMSEWRLEWKQMGNVCYS